MAAKILIASNVASDKDLIKEALPGHEILIACDHHEALSLVETHQDIALVLLDLNIPYLNGLQVLETLRTDARYRGVPTIIITDGEEPDLEVTALRLGAIDYLCKPLRANTLALRVNTQLELLQMRHQKEYEFLVRGLTFETLFDQAPVGIAIAYSSEPQDASWNHDMIVNAVFEEIVGRTQEELCSLGWAHITHPDDLEKDLTKFKLLKEGKIPSYSLEKRFIKPDGTYVWVSMVVAPLTSSPTHPDKHICLIQDITQRKLTQSALIESERSKAVLLSHLPGMAYRCKDDYHWTMEYVSAGCYALTGYQPDQLLFNQEADFESVISPEYRDILRAEWRRVLPNRKPFKHEYEIITATGERKWVLEMGEGVYNAHGEVEALEGIILDISDRKHIEDQLLYSSAHDPVTGLLNRKSLIEILERDAKESSNRKRALVGVNLGTMHLLSLRYGYHYSHTLFKQIAQDLERYSDDTHQLFCIHEFRFIFYVTDYQDTDALVALCHAIAHTIGSILSGERINGGISVLEISEKSEQDVEELLKDLLITSENAINIYETDIGICFFNKELEEQIMREETINRELTQVAMGIKPERLFMLYQPVLDIKTDRICSFEALARLNSDTYGLISPVEFIPIAEKTKLIVPLGYQLARQALQFLNRLKHEGYPDIHVAFNLSAYQLLKHDFPDELIQLIQEMQVDPTKIELEITETVFASNYQEINRIVGVLQSHGIRIIIDDFGTGYSSLARQSELNADCLKIDRYFIEKLLWLHNDKAITSDIIGIGHKLGHDVVAEGVEQYEQLQYLSAHQCDKMQGYLLSTPLDADQAIRFLKAHQD
jgi:PAS domain S-box-containing protein